MSWRNDLRRASFRGVRFFVADSSAEFGQRTSSHEFPNRNKPYEEVLGRRQQVYNVEAFLVGFDYNRQRDRLIAAAEDPSPGELVHPYYGNKTVVCQSVRIAENARRGGTAAITFVFVEAGELRFPTVEDDPVGLLNSVADAAQGAADQDFESKFSVTRVSGFVQDNAVDKVREFADYMDVQTQGIRQTTDDINELAFLLTDLRNDTLNVINEPARVRRGFFNSIDFLASASLNLGDVFGAMKNTFTFGSDDTEITRFSTASRLRSQSNNRAVNEYVSITATTRAAKIAGRIPTEAPELIPSIEDALEIRTDLVENIYAQIEVATDEEVINQLQNLATQVIRAMPPEDEDLPRLLTVKNRSTRSSLSLAYQLYGNLNNEQDLIDRNSVEHPGFVLGGRDLKILSDD